MDHFPAFLALRGRAVLLVGGGDRAAAKLRLLLKSGAEVTVVAPRLGDGVAELVADGRVRWVARGFVGGDVGGRAAVFAATGLDAVDARVAEAARLRNLPVNVVDRQDLSTFIVPAIVERDPVVVGISTGGASPVLARRLREEIEAILPARLGALARFAGSFRAAVGAVVPAHLHRRFWERLFDGPIAGRVLIGDERGAREAMLAAINSRAAAADEPGRVAIVGAGPGDPDLLTLRALRLLQSADVVVHDKLVGEDVLDYVRRDAERIYVGKSRGNHSLPQPAINDLLVRHARAGRRVVRLKGGDPFVFGRGGEEVAHLRRAGVAVELVPGITAATAAGAAAGIPLTHRDAAQAVTLVTGQGREGDPDIDWAALARLNQTLVIYMGVAAAGRIAARLIGHGLAGATPVAVVENASRADQRVLAGELAGLEALVCDHAVTGPAVIVVGEVVRVAALLPALAADAGPLLAAGGRA